MKGSAELNRYTLCWSFAGMKFKFGAKTDIL